MKYHIYATVIGDKYLGVVEAKSEDEAIEQAQKLDSSHISLCHVCSREIEDPEITNITAEID